MCFKIHSLKSRNQNSRSLGVKCGGGRPTEKGHKGTFWGDTNDLYFDWGMGLQKVYTFAKTQIVVRSVQLKKIVQLKTIEIYVNCILKRMHAYLNCAKFMSKYGWERQAKGHLQE